MEPGGGFGCGGIRGFDGFPYASPVRRAVRARCRRDGLFEQL